MNIVPAIIPLMNCAIVVKHARSPIFDQSGRMLSSRKFVRISEIKNVNTIHDIFSWNASSDTFQEDLSNSFLLKKIAKSLNISMERLMRELENRKKMLLSLVEQNIRDYHSLNDALSKYYHDLQLRSEKFSEKF